MESINLSKRINIFTDELVNGAAPVYSDKKEIHRGDMDDGDIVDNMKAETEVINVVDFEGMHHIKQSTLNGDKNFKGGLDFIINRPSIPKSIGHNHTVKMMNQPVDWKDLNIQELKQEVA